MSVRVLSASAVERISAKLQPLDLQCLMAQVFSAVSGAQNAVGHDSRASISVQTPHRISVSTDNHSILFMPARLGIISPVASSDDSLSVAENVGAGCDTRKKGVGYGTAIKVVSVPKASDPRGLPATTMVIDEATGSVKAIVNARKLTALRNAAGSLLSTTLVAKRHPTHIVTFGAGNQIESHLDLHLRFFEGIERCTTIVNRTMNDRVAGLVDRLSKSFTSTQFSAFSSSDPSTPFKDTSSHTRQVEDALATADLIICATSSTVPLFESSWVKSGTHIILIGSYTPQMHEIDTDMVHRATIPADNSPFKNLLVDSRDACFKEAGELIKADISQEEVTEIGELIPIDNSGRLDTAALESLLLERRDSKQRTAVKELDFVGPVTIFKSVGIGLQDVAIGGAVVSLAEQLGIGQVIDDYDV